jgi:hypothetical protein
VHLHPAAAEGTSERRMDAAQGPLDVETSYGSGGLPVATAQDIMLLAGYSAQLC